MQDTDTSMVYEDRATNKQQGTLKEVQAVNKERIKPC
jgi:hypothetical protein